MTKLKRLKSATLKTTKHTPKIGAHLSIAGGYENGLIKAKEIGANCLQIFSASPRNWNTHTTISKEKTEEFINLKNRLQIDPIYFHASYLINLADSGRVGRLSVTSLVSELILAEKLDIRGSIVHLGSFKGQKENYEILLGNINEVLKNTPPKTLLIIENAGNKKICCTLNEMWYIVRRLNSDRVRVCLDTCHLWTAGYNLSTPQKFSKFFSEFDKKIGLEKLELFQVNDAKDALGSFRDRHENLGDGKIPAETFRLLMTSPLTKDLPMILEVPGSNKKGPDKKNVKVLGELAANGI